MNKIDYLQNIREIVAENPENAEYVEFLDKEIAADIAKRAKEAERRAAKKAEPDAYMDAILECVGEEPITAAEIADKLVGEYPEITRNKVTFRLAKAAKEGRIAKNEIKADGKKYVAYTIA